MGLLDSLMGREVPGAGPTFDDRLNRPLTQIGLAIMANAGQQNGGGAIAGVAQGLQNSQKIASKNKTLDYLKTHHPDIAGMVDSGLEPGEAFAMAIRKEAEDREQKRWDANQQFAQQKFSYEQSQDAIQNELARTKLTAGGGAEYGLQPVYGRDADGNITIGQLGKDGSIVQSRRPEGFTPLSPYETNFGKAQGSAEGKVRGESVANLPAAESQATQLLGVIEDIERDPYRERGTGASSVFNAIPATGGYDFAQKVEQLKGQTFLQAFESLKGAGQITEIEGQKATQAIARLSTAQSEEAFSQALQDLKGVVQLGLSRSRQKAGASGDAMGGAAGGGGAGDADPLGLR